jgi:hypothetical protein
MAESTRAESSDESKSSVGDIFWGRRIDAEEVRRRLTDGDEWVRRAIVRRLLEYGEWEEIRALLTLDAIARDLPYIRFRSSEVESFWKEAVAFWRSQAR